jgi:chemotaxis protein methyltransferase CheR
MELVPFKEIIKEKCGLTFEEVRTDTLADGIRSRMSSCGMVSWGDYLARLLDSEAEFTSLINLLTINETYFFREPAHLELLTNRLFPELLAARKPGDRIRILSAGCSTGEEPYSIMIALMEKYGIAIRNCVSVIGADIDSEVLGRAEQGSYNVFSFRNFPEQLRDRYFTSLGNGQYGISSAVKDCVRFQRLNLMSDAYPPDLQGVDALFFRNVSIYFDAATQKNVFGKLAGLLNETGYLFVSSTETLSHDHGILSLIEVDGVFCYRRGIELSLGERRRPPLEQKPEAAAPKTKKKAAPVRPPEDVQETTGPGRSSQAVPAQAGDPERTPSPQFDEALALAKRKNYEEALRLLDKIEKRHPSFVKGCMLKAGILINMKLFEDAEQVCLQAIARDRWCLEGHLLLGLISKMRDDGQTALNRFKEALYIDTSCWLAHFHAAEIYAGRGELKGACREYEIVIKLLQKGTLSDHGLTFFPFAFQAEQVMHLCRHNLSKVKANSA